MSQRWPNQILLAVVVVAAGATLAASHDRPPASAAAPDAGGATFIETFDGRPGQPLPWRPDDWDVTVHSRDRETWERLEPMHAMHGPDCSGPPATHVIDGYEQAVFLCNDHMMTAISAGGYGMVYLTPPYLVNFSSQEALIRFDLSTLRQSPRDWIDIWITPYDDNLQLALDDSLPDGAGEPRRGIHVTMAQFNDQTVFYARLIEDHVATKLSGGASWVGYETFLTPDARRRDTFELRLSRNHIRFGMPDYNHSWVDSALPGLSWGAGVVQLGHHSYNPAKDCPTCSANTWHWDNISIAPAIPFTIIPASQRAAGLNADTSVSFARPAPAYAHLRFAGVGNRLELSYDGGKSWRQAQLQAQESDNSGDGSFRSYWTPIPPGTTSVLFRGEDWWGGAWHVRDISIWSNAICYGQSAYEPGLGPPAGAYDIHLPTLMRPRIC